MILFIKKTAFSLIELLITIAIIGILSAIAIPSYKNMSLSSKQTSMLPQLTYIYNLIRIHYKETGSYKNLNIPADQISIVTDYCGIVILLKPKNQKLHFPNTKHRANCSFNISESSDIFNSINQGFLIIAYGNPTKTNMDVAINHKKQIIKKSLLKGSIGSSPSLIDYPELNIHL